MRKEKILSADQPCSRCGGQLELREHDRNWHPPAGQRYWFRFWFECSGCSALYMVEAAKVFPRQLNMP